MSLRASGFAALAGLLVFGAAFWWLFGLIFPPDTPLSRSDMASRLAPLAILIGAATAYFVFVITSYLQGRAARVTNALTALQALRTDRDYLERATRVTNRIGGFSQPISPDILLKLTGPKAAPPEPCPACDQPVSRVIDPSLAQDVDFLLNQYEFLAAATRLNAFEFDLLRHTIRSTILGLVLTFEPYIKYERARQPAIWQNLVWIAHRFDPKVWHVSKGRLGPPPGR